MINEVLKELSQGKNIPKETMRLAMLDIMEDRATEIQISSFLTALKIKGETIDEITGTAEVMKEKCIKTELGTTNTLDIVGTGGDMSGTFNISTAAAFVAAACGIPVAKHGNRALTSKTGSIDVLEALGINVNKTPEQEKEIFNKINICFMFAQNHHPAMKFARNVRKELNFRTLFNILGPLTNPASANCQLLGVYDINLVEKLVKVISDLGVKNVMVVHGKDGIDEATTVDETFISENRNGILKTYTIKPEDFNIKRAKKEDILGADAKTNAKIILDIFSGKERGAKYDIVLLNSALSFYIFNKVSSINDGIFLASNIINSGLALDKLNRYIEISK